MSKMAAFGTIAIIVFSRIIVFFNGSVKQVSGLPDLFTDPWQVQEFEWAAILLYEVF